MADYRIYLFNGIGRFSPAKVISAETDEEALFVALGMKCTHGFEVWQGARKVSSLRSVEQDNLPDSKSEATSSR